MNGPDIHSHSPPDADGPRSGKLPYIGDKVVLLFCPRHVREELRAMGLHGGNLIDNDGGDGWLNKLPAAAASVSHDELTATLRTWLEVIRNEAAMTGQICTVWMPSMPAEIAQGIRNACRVALIEITAASAADAARQIEAFATPPLQSDGKVWAICSIRNGGVGLLPHWLTHYLRLGADRLLIGVYDDVSPEARAAIERFTAGFPATIFSQTWSGNHELVQEDQRRSACRVAGASPGTWIVHTDLDEFHEFPAPLPETVAAAEARNFNVIFGQFLDRVAGDGSLPPIQPAPSIWEQFPVKCHLTAKILRGCTRKVMLAKFHAPCGPGHHNANNMRVGFPIGAAHQYIVHHFKWHRDVIERLLWGMSQPNANVIWKSEGRTFLKWLKSNNWRIDLAKAGALSELSGLETQHIAA